MDKLMFWILVGTLILVILIIATIYSKIHFKNNSNVKVMKKEQFSLNDIEYIYDGEIKSLSINGELPEGVSVTYKGNNQVNAGKYTVCASFSSINDNDLQIEDLTATLNIKKGTYNMSGVKFNNKSYLYDGKEKELSISGDLPETVKVIYDCNKFVDAGKYTVTASFEGDYENFNIIPDMVCSLTIKKAVIDMSSVNFKSKTYKFDSKKKKLSISGSLPKGITVKYKKASGTDIGVYHSTASFTLPSKNYKSIPPMHATLTILDSNYDMSGIKFEEKSFVYDGKQKKLAVSGTIPNGVTVNYINNNHTDIGNYVVVARFNCKDQNYKGIEYLATTLSITKPSNTI